MITSTNVREVKVETKCADTVAAKEAIYAPPALVTLGNLGEVQAGRGYYYDGPNTTWLRYS